MTKTKLSHSMTAAAIVALVYLGGAVAPRAAQAEGVSDHLLLPPPVLEQLRVQATEPGSAMQRVIALCRDAARDPYKYRKAGFQGEAFASKLATCALAFRVTGRKEHGRTAMRYFHAILDDFLEIGDRKGGDDVVTHNTGYAMRFFGTYAGLAYDWLNDAPGMTATLRKKARGRFVAWTNFYRTRGYLRDSPGANYHAGYVAATALMAAALQRQNDPEAAELMAFVRDRLVGHDLVLAMHGDGVLVGGGWPEGWQYGPLSALHYAMAIRVLDESSNKSPLDSPDVQRWADSLVERFVHGLAPGADRMYVGGDTGERTPYIEPNSRVLYAVLLISKSPLTRQRAARIIEAIRYRDKAFPMFEALAEAQAAIVLRSMSRSAVAAASNPLEVGELTYLTEGTRTLYARSSRGPNAAWFVAQCSSARVPDHQHVNAGNFVLSLGSTDLITDPTPYGSLATTTGNAPTVVSKHLPATYWPSQAGWGQDTNFVYGARVGSILVAKCDYTDQYQFKSNPPDIDRATRAFVVQFRGDNATVVLIDNVAVGGEPRSFELRLRSPASWKKVSSTFARASSRGASMSVKRTSESGAWTVSPLNTYGNCWDGPRGSCRFARHSGSELRFDAMVSNAQVVHVLRAGVGKGIEHAASASTGGRALARTDGLVVESPQAGIGSSSVAVGGALVLLDAFVTNAVAKPTSDPNTCNVSYRARPSPKAGAVVVEVDGSCGLKAHDIPVRAPVFTGWSKVHAARTIKLSVLAAVAALAGAIIPLGAR